MCHPYSPSIGCNAKLTQELATICEMVIVEEKHRKVDELEDIFEMEEAERRRMFKVRGGGRGRGGGEEHIVSDHLCLVKYPRWHVC